MFEFRIFNVPVRVEPWFWVVMALLGGAMGADSKEALVLVLIFMVAGFISILVHELGHALMARHFGNRVHILLYGMGGLAFREGGRNSRKRDFMIAAAGPAIQIALGLAVILAFRASGNTNPYLSAFVAIFFWISVIWALLNLLPILPLDGGRLLESVLGPRRMRTTLTVSAATAAGAAVFALLGGYYVGAIFAGYLAYQSYKQLQQPSWR
ncbi:M50 family metallopeptidase [Akkermansiaceae bacterium]|nr:M50 family metallopeptidase [Akkermansiaceae bacterium]